MTREELIQKYVDNQKEIKRIKEESLEIKKEIALTFEHKVGEIVKWAEKGRRKNVGSYFHPKYEDLPDIEHEAVLTNVSPNINIWFDGKISMSWELTFRPIKKDGHISMNRCYVDKDKIEWTGDIYKNYQTKE